MKEVLVMENFRYYIVPGAETKMYTLRVRYDDKIYFDGESTPVIRDEYIRNLSIDKDRAVLKARAFIGDATLLSDTDNLEDLEEIRRREAAEVAAAREAKEAEERAERESKINQLVDYIVTTKVMPFGKYKGDPISQLPRSYVLFWLRMDNDSTDPVLDALQTVFKSIFPMLEDLPSANGEYMSVELKKRLTFDVTVVESFGFDGFYGWVSIKKYVTDDGYMLTYMGSGRSPGEVGDKLTIKGTVKKFEDYNGEKSTYLARIVEVKSK